MVKSFIKNKLNKVVLKLLANEDKNPYATDESFLNKLPRKIIIPSRKGSDNQFLISHFAGDVTYSIKDFLKKNNDSLQAVIQIL